MLVLLSAVQAVASLSQALFARNRAEAVRSRITDAACFEWHQSCVSDALTTSRFLLLSVSENRLRPRSSSSDSTTANNAHEAQNDDKTFIKHRKTKGGLNWRASSEAALPRFAATILFSCCLLVFSRLTTVRHIKVQPRQHYTAGDPSLLWTLDLSSRIFGSAALRNCSNSYVSVMR